ncbi:MAG TPA: AMP-binding protein, partial [Bacteroidales bacterium]
MFLDSFFESSASQYPDAIAIEDGNRLYKYREVDRITNRLAAFLQHTYGIKPEEKVAILLPRCAEVYIAMISVLKAGGAYIPLDPEAPAHRVNFIMEDSGARVLITADSILRQAGCQLNPFPIFKIDEQLHETDTFPDTQPSGFEKRSPGDLCYIIYTSGTIGNPKGVLIEHRNAVNYICGARQIYPIDSSYRVLQGFSVSFDASVEEIWLPLSAGATLVVGTFEIMRSGDRFASILNKLSIDFLSCAPTLLSMVTEDIPGLKVLIFGGEVCPTDLAHRWCKNGRIVYNTYGPTEATVIA